MKYIVNYDGIDKYWKNDYFFCEDKILATMAEKFGCKYDLMFAGAFDFGYNKGRNKEVGSNMVVRYFDQDMLLEKYYGIHINKFDEAYGGADFLERSKEELLKGIPTAVELTRDGIWDIKPGEDLVEATIFLLVEINDETVTVIDPHELGIRRVVSKEIFIRNFAWGVTFECDKNKVDKEIDVKDFLKYVICNCHRTLISNEGCIDATTIFPSMQSGKDNLLRRKVEDPYEEMLQFAEDVISMDFDAEINGLESVLFTPFYYGLLYTYRSRLVFTKALRELEERIHLEIFEPIIEKLIVTSSKWNYLRMVFTNCYHNGGMSQKIKDEMSSVIREIAEIEKIVMADLQKMYDSFDDYKKEIDLSEQFNTYLFDNENWKSIDEGKAVYGRYYYEPLTENESKNIRWNFNFILPEPNEKGDSLVCLGQELSVDEEITTAEFNKFYLYGTVLYNEMIYDQMEILYTDGSKEKVLIGFDGWIENDYKLCEGAKAVWQGKIIKRNSNEAPDVRRKAVIYEKSYSISKGKKVQGFVLPNNPFINIIKVIFTK